jgi:hypothetical protein
VSAAQIVAAIRQLGYTVPEDKLTPEA